MKTLLLFTGILLLTSPAKAQSNERDVRGGILIGSLSRYGEDIFEGTNGTLGGWIDITSGQWALECDVARSRQLRVREEGCIPRACDANGPASQFAPATRRERNWTVSAEALRRFRLDADAPYFLVGAGVITRHNALVFDDRRLPQHTFRRFGVAPVAGVGIDFFVDRVVVRFQYRYQTFVFGFPGIAAAQHVRIGAGWDF